MCVCGGGGWALNRFTKQKGKTTKQCTAPVVFQYPDSEQASSSSSRARDEEEGRPPPSLSLCLLLAYLGCLAFFAPPAKDVCTRSTAPHTSLPALTLINSDGWGRRAG